MVQGFFKSSVPLDNVQVSHLFAAYVMENFDLYINTETTVQDSRKEPVIISPTAHGVTRAKLFRNALTKLNCLDSTMALAIHIKGEKKNVAAENMDQNGIAIHNDDDDEVNDSIDIPLNETSKPEEEQIPYEIIGDVKGKDVLIVDNMIITGSTLVGVSKKLIQEGANRVIAIATHGMNLIGEKDLFRSLCG